MRYIKYIMLLAAFFGLASCAEPVKPYDGPEITRIVLLKGERRLHLMHGNTAIKSYDVELGFAPEGHKGREGDGKTPEGVYFIDRKNPNSAYHLSVGISYPNSADAARASAAGVPPGGDIFIHGTPRLFARDRDWTAGCIAVTDQEIEEIFSIVRVGTPILIYP